MTSFLHVRRHLDYFHGHPGQSAFSLIATLVLAALVVLVLVTGAR